MLSSLIKTINRHKWISEAAYFRAKARDFESGKALDDWLAAEIAYATMLIAVYVKMLAEDGPLTVVSLQQLAALIGIENSDGLVSELELVQAIQRAIKHRTCFQPIANKVCDEMDCHWRTECRKLISVWC
jgi:hypothetical protein